MKQRKGDKPCLAPLCYICVKRRSTSRDNCCDACRSYVKENGGRLPGSFLQHGYSPEPKPAPPQQTAWLPSADTEG